MIEHFHVDIYIEREREIYIYCTVIGQSEDLKKND